MDVKSLLLLLLSVNFALCTVTSSDESRGDGDDFGLFAFGPSDVGQMSRPMLRPSRTHGAFSFPNHEDNYLYFPKQRDLKSARLHNILGSSFDPFWMSVKRPSSSGSSGSTTGDTGPLAKRSSAVRNAATAAGRKLHAAARALNFTVLTDSGAAVTATEATVAFMTRWLLQKAECGVASSWHDLGSVFWPRWIRLNHCEESGGGGGGGCSWPAGMSCAPAQSTHIKILAWHCYALRSAAVDGQPPPHQPLQKCGWRLVPYPLVTACTCGCGKHSTGHGWE
uniref:Noggin D n=1 Tax=Lampetra fluviatilis TaxID=7748 RepID=A0A7L9K554_LAMFL|nr:noggin D [Lampetra fluviatilis]